MNLVNFKNLREYRGVTQKELCAALGITVNYLSLIENGHKEPSWKVFKDMCEVLNYRIIFETKDYLK